MVKTTGKRFVSAIMAMAMAAVMAVMVICFMPVEAHAETITETADFGADALHAIELLGGNERVVYDMDNKEITLKGVDFSTSAPVAVKLPADVTLVLESGTENRIISTYNGEFDSHGIEGSGLTICGEGSLEVLSGTSEGFSFGISAPSITILGGEVTATGGEAPRSSGISATFITISGGKVTGKGGKAQYNSWGIIAQNAGSYINISGSSVVTAIGGEADDSEGISSSWSIAISGGELTAKGGNTTESEGLSLAILAYNSIEITGGKVTATAGRAIDSYAIASEDYVEISDGTVTATGGEAKISAGILANSSVTISGGAVTAIGGTATDPDKGGSVAIAAMDSFVISGGTVTARGDTMALYIEPVLDDYINYIAVGAPNIRDGLPVDLENYIAENNSDYKYFHIKPLTTIVTASITGVTAPAAGAVPMAAGSLMAGEASYTVTGLTWQNNDGSPATLTGREKFKAGSTYQAVIELTAAAGYKFRTKRFTPEVSAGTAGAGTISGGDAEGNKLTFTVTFDQTEALQVTGIALTTQPAKMSYTEGTDKTLALNGMVVTVTNNDGSTAAVTFTAGTAEGYTTNPANGTALTRAAHNNTKVTVTHTASGQTAQTGSLTVTSAPPHDNGGGSGETSPPIRTISVTETSSALFDGAGKIRAEANMNSAFSDSVEVKIRDTQGDAADFGLSTESRVYPFDISLYIKGTNNKTQPADGYAVTISLPIPRDLLDSREQLSVVHKSDSGTVTRLASKLLQMNGTWYLVFGATEFSPYALVVSDLGKQASVRFAGINRVDTALAIAKAAYPDKVTNVVLATADNYPDALAGSVLAYQLNAPILLVGSSKADQEKVLDYLNSNLKSEGMVYILGGTGVISQRFADKLNTGEITDICRIAGNDRYDTSVKIAEQLNVKIGTPVVLVSGENYPDALAVCSIAAQNQLPILLVPKEGISDAVSQKIAAIKPDKVYLIGLEGAISDTVESKATELTDLAAGDIIRIGGADRYATSLAIAKYFNLGSQTVCLATGNNFPDALAGSVYAAKYKAPIILIDNTLPVQTADYIKSIKPLETVIFGGEAVIGITIEEQIKQLL